MGNINIADRRDLEKSLKHWKAELAKDAVVLSKAARAEEAARRQVQIAKSTIERRESQLRKLNVPDHGRAEAVRLGLSFVGTVEKPAGSNGGPNISAWEDRFGMGRGPWCGAFVGAMVEMAGADVTPRIVYTPYIYEDAVCARNGLERVVWEGHFLSPVKAHSGDLVLFDFGTGGGIKHVAMLRKPWSGKGPLLTVEGNTSFGPGGSQDNGGAVARRERDVSLVHSIVSVRWP